MERVREVVKGFVTKTKERVEGNREERIREIFHLVFGFEPERVTWIFDHDQGTVLQAETKIKLDEETLIEGKKVVKVEFYLKEEKDPEKCAYDINWEFSRSSRGPWSVYKWKKRLKGFTAFVEILTD